jgi:hypothetical protein
MNATQRAEAVTAKRATEQASHELHLRNLVNVSSEKLACLAAQRVSWKLGTRAHAAKQILRSRQTLES